MANPNIPQGSLNRLKVSVVLSTFPELNVTPAFMGREMANLSFEGNGTIFVPTSTGAITSPEPYLKFTLAVHLLKTQALSGAYKTKQETNSLLGDITLYPDVQLGTGLSTYFLSNSAIESVGPMKLNGTEADFVVMIGGQYYINQDLFN